MHLPTSLRSWLAGALIVLVAGVVAGCGSAPAASGGTVTSKQWQWAETTLQNNATINDPSKYTIQFSSDGTFSGQNDCNQIAGSYTTTSSGGMTITPGPSTLAACPPGSLSDIYLAGLSGVTSYALTDGRLVLNTTGGTMTFK